MLRCPLCPQITEEVLERLLTVVVSDLSPTIRLTVLRAFNSNFDVYLCQAHHLHVRSVLSWSDGAAVQDNTWNGNVILLRACVVGLKISSASE